MIYLSLFFEFFKVGLFSVGGGLATIPFLQEMGTRTGWFTAAELTNMIAVSESTPGPMGVNMASYVGFHLAGPVGCAVATLGLVAPSVIVILIIAGFLQKFRDSRAVNGVFYGLRPASTGLIAAAGLSVAAITLLNTSASGAGVFQWKAILLFLAVFLVMQHRKLKKLHPIVLILLSAVAGVVFQM